MLFEVRRQRIRGVPIPRQDLSHIVPVRGDLRVQERPAEEMGRRVCRVATLHTLDRAIEDEMLPRLHDVSLLWMAPLGMVLGGIEFDGGVGYMQSWFVTPWERSTSFDGRPSELVSHEMVGHHRDGTSTPTQRRSNAQQLAPEAESICQQENRTAEPAAASSGQIQSTLTDLF